MASGQPSRQDTQTGSVPDAKAKSSVAPKAKAPGKISRQTTQATTDAKAKSSTVAKAKAPPRLYQPGNWDDCRFFMPTVTDIENNSDAVAQFRQTVVDLDYTAARLLLNAGFPVNQSLSPVRERAALHLAAETGDIMMCKLLLQFKANPHQNCKVNHTRASAAFALTGRTPLDIAKAREHIPVVHLFSISGRAAVDLDRGVDPPARIEFPLRVELKANEPGLMGPREPKLATNDPSGTDTSTSGCLTRIP